MNAKTLTAKIMLYLHENPGASIKDLSLVLSVGVNTVRSVLYRLRSNGYVERVGNGYILTSKGEWFINNVVLKKTSSEQESPREENVEEAVIEAKEERKTVETSKEESLRERIDRLEKQLNDIRRLVDQLAKQLEEVRKTVRVETAGRRDREKSGEKIDRLPRPVMNIQEAINALGPLIDELKLEGKVEIIDSIVVDTVFLEEFKKKFPISVNEVDKLSVLEKTLLDAMIKDARVIKHAGKYYKLIA